MKKIMVFGTFDGLHKGHLDFFKQAREYGDFLVIVVAQNANVIKVKGKRPCKDENERLRAVEESGFGDKVILGDEIDPYKVITEELPDVICLGYDQHGFADKLQNKLEELQIEVKIVRLKPYHPEKYKSKILNRV